MEAQPIILPGLTPREAIVDAYYRMAWAFDNNNWDLFASAWTTKQIPAFHIDDFQMHLTGIEDIKANLWDRVSQLDTQHIAANPRVLLKPGATTARMWIMCLNQHFRKGQQAVSGSPRLWGGNKYMFELVEEDGLWKVKEFWVEMGWNEGDKSIVGR